MYQLSFNSWFVKRYSKLSNQERKLVDDKLRILSENPWHPSLRVKKIQSTEEYECSVNMDVRIAFIFDGETIIVLLDVDHHDKLIKRRTR